MHVRLNEAVQGRFGDRTEFMGRRVHMIGVGGCGMSAAAHVLHQRGAIVTGSDLNPFDGMGPLVQGGVRVSIGHRAEHVDPAVDLVVISAAIPESNPELEVARRRNVPVIKYAALLGQITRGFDCVAVAGTHGKSTTTAMTAHVFREAGLSPSFIFGAQSDQLGGSSAAGVGPHFIVESCEFDRSFLQLRPHMAGVLNIEPDHLDCYQSFEAIVEAFGDFARLVDDSGLVICNGGDRWARAASRESGATVETFGLDGDVDWRAVNLQSDRGRFSFDVHYRNAPILSTRLALPGLYNVQNALAAMAFAYHAGAACHRIADAVGTFAGVSRRLAWRGEGCGVQIIDDYAHHPTEIRVTIAAARDRYLPKRIFVVFQPHQYERTRRLLEDFATSFQDVHEVVIPDVYGARESVEGMDQTGSAELVTRICANGGRARYLPTLGAAAEHVLASVADGDLVVTMGAGDVWKVADELVERIC